LQLEVVRRFSCATSAGERYGSDAPAVISRATLTQVLAQKQQKSFGIYLGETAGFAGNLRVGKWPRSASRRGQAAVESSLSLKGGS
jgi:hypothetical protein